MLLVFVSLIMCSPFPLLPFLIFLHFFPIGQVRPINLYVRINGKLVQTRPSEKKQ